MSSISQVSAYNSDLYLKEKKKTCFGAIRFYVSKLRGTYIFSYE